MDLTQARLGTGTNARGKPLSCGARLSILDLVVLLLTIPLTWAAWSVVSELALVVPFVVGHFFLFCNVFRIHRSSELVWAGFFVLNASVHVLTSSLSLLTLCGPQLLLTVVLIAKEMRRDDYHGIFSSWLNPKIDEYLCGELYHRGDTSRRSLLP